MKNASRNKFLLCFRPVVDMDTLVLDSGHHRDVSGNSTTRGPCPSPSPSPSPTVKCIHSDHNKESSKTSSSKKKFSQVIIKEKIKIFLPVNELICDSKFSCLFVTLQVAKSSTGRERKSLSQDEFEGKLVKSFSVGHIQEIKSNAVLLSSKSSLGSTSSSSVLSESKASPQKKSHLDMGGSSSFSSSKYYAISLLLMSLAVTILWGKVCAILFTSIWFYFIPQQTNFRPPENVKKKKMMIIGKRSESFRDNYRKRIIMEGLLERNGTTIKIKETALNF